MGISITWVIDFSITMVIIQPIAQFNAHHPALSDTQGEAEQDAEGGMGSVTSAKRDEGSGD